MTNAPVVLTEDELVDFALRVARLMTVTILQQDNIPIYIQHLASGAVSPSVCLRICKDIMAEMNAPGVITDNPPNDMD